MPTARIHVTYGINREGQEVLAQQLARTWSGMAHTAGSGPAGKTCRECIHWAAYGKWEAAKPLGAGGSPQPAACRKYTQLAVRRGEKIPHNAPACKYFDETGAPQPLKRPARTEELWK